MRRLFPLLLGAALGVAPAGVVQALEPQPSATLPAERGLDFEMGRAMFEKLWVSSPASTKASDGLGPLYNARACAACHVSGGRGRLPAGPDETPVALALHLAVPANTPAGMAEIADFLGTAPDPVYGAQIQTFGAPGQAAEAQVRLRWRETETTLSDGTVVALREPLIDLRDLAKGDLAPDAMISARLAPPLTGLGLLEDIPAADILAREDPDDVDGDGISGRANFVPSPEDGTPTLGRFGLKAGSPTLAHQTAKAFATDIGISSSMFPAAWGDCTGAQSSCRAAPHGDGDVRVHEIGDEAFDVTLFYVANLAVPTRRGQGDSTLRAGEALFHEAGCAACHVPQPDPAVPETRAYTDLLLHDMGPGLADGFTEGRATGREWRTPPLWGIGLTPAATGETNLLHDGRARTLFEAILWHGGEARAARDAVANMKAADRDALITFLESL